MKRFLTAALALTALVAGPTIAAADDDRGRGKKHGHHKKHDRGDRDWDDRDDRRDERRAYRQGYRDGRWAEDRYVHVQPRHHYTHSGIWRRGQVLPYEYRRQVIYDPYRYGLYAPPRGHAWMHVNNDVYLTELATGLIVQVLRDSFY